MLFHAIPAKYADIPKPIIDEVVKLSPHYYLFGSRYMATYWGYSGRVNKNTDWDFAFPYGGSEQQEVRLAESLGWKQKHCEKYKDDMHFITWEKVLGEYKVQMCSKIDLGLFIQTFQRISPEFYWRYLHKSSPDVLPKELQTEVFNQMYLMRG